MFNVHIFLHGGETEILTETRKIKQELEKVKMTQDELVVQLQADSAKIIKIGTETRGLLDKVAALLAQIAAGEVNQAVTDAAADVQTQLGIVDDLVPDAPTP